MLSRDGLWRGFSVILVSILLLSSTARSQVAPIGAHHTSVGGGAGHMSPVSPTGGYSATVPISLPSPRGGLPLPFELRYTGTGQAGAAGIGWDVPLWYVRRSESKWNRKPAIVSDLVGEDAFPERVFLSMGSGVQRMVPGPEPGRYLPYAADEYMELVEIDTGSTSAFILSTASGVEYEFKNATIASGLDDPSLWLLTAIRDRVGTDSVVLRYSGLLLTGFSYTTAPQDDSFAFLGDVGLDQTPRLYDVALEYAPWLVPANADLEGTTFDVGVPGSLGWVVGTFFSGEAGINRSQVLRRVEVRARDNLDTSSSLRTIRTYYLGYAPDEDTTAPRLKTVDVAGDEAMSTDRLPVARYEYGSITQREEGVSHPGVNYDPGDPYGDNWVEFGAPVVVPRDAAALAAGATTLAGSWGHWPSADDDGLLKDKVWSTEAIRDFTGDGVPDLVWKDGGTWHIVKGLVTDEGVSLDGGPTTSWTQPSDIHLQRIIRAKDMTSAANRAKMVTTETIATFVDADGDGRLDVIEANSGVEATWRVWFNREGPEGLPEWEAQQISVDHLVEHLQAHGIEVDPALVPIERSRSWETVEVSWCETWDGYLCWGTSPQTRSGETNTVAEWIFTDVNSDAFPDIVANTVPVLQCEDEVGRYLNESPTSDIEYVHDEFLAMGSCPCNEEPCDEEPSPENEAAVFLNPLGPLVGWGAPHERPPSWMVSADASTGVMRWTTGGGWGGPYNAFVAVGPPWQSAGFRDVHGAGRLVRHQGGGAENAYARFEDDRNRECNRFLFDNGEASGYTTSTQTRGLVDLSGDGVPDFVYREGTATEPTWWVRFGTTAGFGPPREIVSELKFAISESSGYCGALATTKAGLIDLDGDGKPELVRLGEGEFEGELLAASIKTTDGVVGGVHAGRLVAIENGYDARTEIRYANNKTEKNTPHQVAAPEIVVAETQVRVLDGSAADSVITRYAYGTADRRYDPGAERKVFTGYRRTVMLVGGSTDRTGSDLVEGYAILVDRAPPSGFGAGYAAFVLGGRVQETHRLEGIFGPDPRELLWLEAPYPQVRAHQSFIYEVTELDVRPWTDGAVGLLECHDLREDGAADTSDLLCHHAGVVTPSAVFEWEGLEAPSQGARNVARATAVIEADERGRPLEIVQYGDMRTYADDRCLTIQYASSAGSPLSAVAGIWTTDCGWTNATMSSLGGVWVPGAPIMIAGQRFLYDDLPQGSVGRGRLTSRIVENYDTSDGSFLGEHVAVVLAYDALGNVERSVTSRELGTLATRTTTFVYDEFGASLRITTESATDVTQTFTQTAETSTWPSKPAIATDLNGVTTTTTRDHFGRPVHTHLGAAGFSHVVEEVSYSPDGREVTGTTYPAGAGTPRRIHVHLDALGRPRFRQIELGASYGHATLVTDLVEYDGFGRPVYTAAPFEWAVLPFSPDDLPADPGAWPFGVTTAYDSGGLWVRTVEAPGKQPDALKTDVAADIFVSRVERTWEAGRALTRARGPSENSPGEVSFDAWSDTLATALGWPIESARFDANGTRIDLVRRGFDRFGSEAVVERFKQPASATTPVTWTRRYDSLGRLLRLSEPGTAPITHLYDEWGGLLESSWTGAGGVENVSRFAYDGFGRQTLAEIVSVSLQGIETVQSRELAHYDAHSGRSEQPTGDLRGRLSWIEIPKVSAVYFGYDEVGRTSSETHSVSAYGPPVRTSRVFEPGGSLRELRFDTPAGTDRIEYRYDSAMRTESIVDVGNGVPLFRGTQMDAETGYHEILLGNGVREVFDHAPDGRRELERWGVTTNSGQRDQWFMARDAEGRLRQENVNHFGSPFFVQHDYDALDRVVRSLVSGPSQSQDERFEYDPLGNLTRKRNFLQSGQDRDYVYSDATDPDRLCRFGLPGSGQSCNGTYDLAGNLIGDAWGTSTGSGNRLLSYDAASRVREIKRGTWQATFQYGPGGGLALTEVKEGSALRRRIWSFGDLIEERTRPDRRTQIERRIPGPLGIVATLRTEDSNSETVYVHGDGRGNRFFTGSDGKIEQELRYRAFGNVLLDSGNPSTIAFSDDLWNGGDDLRELGVVVLGARVFDPVVGRFLQRDPISFSGSSSKGNPYSFAFNDPVNYADPTGLFSMMIYGSLDGQSQGPVSVNIGFFTVMGVDPTAGLGLVMPNVGEILKTANAAGADALTSDWSSYPPAFYVGPWRGAGSGLGPRGRGFLRCAGGSLFAAGCTAAAPGTLGTSLACTGFAAHEAAPGCLSMITGRDEDSVLVNALAAAGFDRDGLRQGEALGTVTAGLWGLWRTATARPVASIGSSGGAVALAPAAGEMPNASRVVHASRIAELGAQEGTVVLGHYTRPVVFGGRTAIQETLPILEDAARQLGGRTLSSLPRDIGAIASELQSARRIVFYTTPNMKGLTAAEMAAIQSDPALLAKTVFVYGGF